MARTPVSDSLVHRDDVATRDAARLDALSAAVEGAARPGARAALVRETAQSAADAWLDDARDALADVLREPSLARDAAVGSVARAELSAHLQGAVPQPDESEVALHARLVAHAVVSAWLSALRRALDAHEALELDARLLPTGDAPGFSAPDVATTLGDAVDPLGLTLEEARAVLAALGAVFASGASIELPLGLALEVAPGGRDAGRWVARVAQGERGDTGGASTGALERSGERAREGAVTDAPERSRLPRKR